MSEQAVEDEVKAETRLEDKYLTFELHGTAYGIEVTKVREIIGLMDMTRVPQTTSHLRGVMNLRGKIVAVLDLRMILGMEAPEDTHETRIIVFETSQAETGLIVDRVCEVLTMKRESIEDAPRFGFEVNTDFVQGMGKHGDSVTILLDFEKAFHLEEPEESP